MKNKKIENIKKDRYFLIDDPIDYILKLMI